MASFNNVILMGNLCREIDLQQTKGGTSVLNNALAVNEKRKDATGNYVDDVAFIEIVLWGRAAEVVAQYLSKGSPLIVQGKIQQDNWLDKDTGANRSKLKVNVREFQFLPKDSQAASGGFDQSSPQSYDQSPQPTTQPPAMGGGQFDGDSDIPF